MCVKLVFKCHFPASTRSCFNLLIISVDKYRKIVNLLKSMFIAIFKEMLYLSASAWMRI